MNWESVKQVVDDEVSQSVVTALQATTKSLLLAPFHCISFSVMSGLLLGKKFKTFISISFAVCMLFVVGSVLLIIRTEDIQYIGYIIAGILAYLLVLLIFHKDLGHKELLDIARDSKELESDLGGPASEFSDPPEQHTRSALSLVKDVPAKAPARSALSLAKSPPAKPATPAKPSVKALAKKIPKISLRKGPSEMGGLEAPPDSPDGSYASVFPDDIGLPEFANNPSTRATAPPYHMGGPASNVQQSMATTYNKTTSPVGLIGEDEELE